MPPDMTALLDDLQAEHGDLDALVVGADLSVPSAAAGWTVGDCLGHLWFFDREATKALVDPQAFAAGLQQVAADPDGYMSATLDEARALGGRLPEEARRTRAALLDALRAADPAAKVPWYGPPMSPASFATARLMEYWAHGQDVADALGVTRVPTARLRHICHLGVRTRGFSYAVRARTPPASEVFVALTAPDGETWTWGEPAAYGGSLRGSALDFCLVVTQRRLAADTELVATGDDASEWLSIAQAFAGGATLTDPGRAGSGAGAG
jgi:uncharacterized protein (TIGR03084 family)